MHTILGSGGAIGIPLAKELTRYTDKIRLVSRTPQKVNASDELHSLDVYDLSKIEAAIAGSEVVYVTIGFAYNLHVWQQTWPVFLQEVIKACKRHKARLVFFDNIYMYDRSALSFMTEESPINAPSKKGLVRQQLHEMIMQEVEKGELTALIARAADFYGPDNRNSAFNMMILDNLLKGKKAQAMGDIHAVHTYTYTPDAARATALLGNTKDAFNQVWHVPTTKERLTALQWIELAAAAAGVKPAYQVAPLWLLRILGIFIPVMRELPEMMYQYESDYIFDSSKFEKRFGIYATAPAEGIRMTLQQHPLRKHGE